MTPPRLPEPAALALSKYRDLAEQHAPSLVAALYVYGSVALDAYVDGQSDIDFIAVLDRQVGPEYVLALERIHRSLADEYPRPTMTGSYLQWHDLGRAKHEIAPYPYYHDGRMHRSGRHDINPVTWWILKHNGIVVTGPPVASLDFEVTWEEVAAYMTANLDSYWARYSRSIRGLLWLLTDDGVQWVVLGISRLFCALRTDSMPSKSQAGQYSLAHVPRRWHALVKEALNLRSSSTVRYYRSRLRRAQDAMAFLKYMIGSCNSPLLRSR